MAIPLIDQHTKYVVDFTIKTVLSDPDKYVKEIFGDARLSPHTVLYGDRLINDIKSWITTTKIPVVLGWDLDPAQIPGVTIHLVGSNPMQSYMGDAGQDYFASIEPFEKEVLVPRFSPKEVTMLDGYVSVILPEGIASELVIPPMHFRDKQGKEFAIGSDGKNPTATQLSVPLSQGDFSEIEVVSPYQDAKYRQGVMQYNETVMIAIHGKSDRTEGLWLWAIVHWGLLKFRPIFTATFGMDLAETSASDFMKDDQFLGENVWRRFITLQAKTIWSWEAARQKDLLAFALDLHAYNKANDC